MRANKEEVKKMEEGKKKGRMRKRRKRKSAQS